ncbi:MAG TPA: AbrB/MazE/SpoVT family DNA-binding domain-containing protein [Candidatus Thermoplasmatota archaeon]|nr:AbrB/MazE/SpoVT family DNA-binding domain-containing protein [Candidatus Thermoplasmatota archaeon]
MRFLRTVHNRGSLTLPSDIRDVLDIQEGDVVEFEILRIVRKAVPSRRHPDPATAGTPAPTHA